MMGLRRAPTGAGWRGGYSRRAPALVAIVLSLVGSGGLWAQQQFPFGVEPAPLAIDGMPGIQSFAYAVHNGEWLLLGGRLDGLHARQPNRSFPASANNNRLWVVSPTERRVWSAGLDGLSTDLADQLQSTNINFYQDGNRLIIAGGYGYSRSARDHITYPALGIIDVAATVAAVKTGQPLAPHIRRIPSELFAVTGGQMGKIGEDLVLVGGHRFDGRYNPANNPTFRQTYTNAIQFFRVASVGGADALQVGRRYEDPEHLRRRDYNLVPQVFPGGGSGYLISSGVFQVGADLPFLYPVEVHADGFRPVLDFEQHLSNYHSGKIGVYDAATAAMHSLFFGGMAQYYVLDGRLVRDDGVPFVSTISRVSRTADGRYQEYVLPVEMPGLLGAGSEFIADKTLLRTGEALFRVDDLRRAFGALPAGRDYLVVGYLVGGIDSPLLNPFASNQTHRTSADAGVYEVRFYDRPQDHLPLPTR